MTTQYTEVGQFWDDRYRRGDRATDAVADKAAYVNEAIARYGIRTMIDWGCGAGDQLAHFDLNGMERYVGTDVSIEAIRQARERFPDLYFIHRPKLRVKEAAELSLSLDVIFHQTTEELFVSHLDDVFDRASRLVVIRSTNTGSGQMGVVTQHHWFTPVVAIRFPDWKLVDGGQGGQFGSARAFYAYEKRQ